MSSSDLQQAESFADAIDVLGTLRADVGTLSVLANELAHPVGIPSTTVVKDTMRLMMKNVRALSLFLSTLSPLSHVCLSTSSQPQVSTKMATTIKVLGDLHLDPQVVLKLHDFFMQSQPCQENPEVPFNALDSAWNRQLQCWSLSTIVSA